MRSGARDTLGYAPKLSAFRRVPLLLGVDGHGGKDGDEFVGFLPDWLDFVGRDVAVVTKEFEPELAFVCFLGT